MPMPLTWRPYRGGFEGDPCDRDEEYVADGFLGRYYIIHYTGTGKVSDCDDGWQLYARIEDEEQSYHLKSREQGEKIASELDSQDLD